MYHAIILCWHYNGSFCYQELPDNVVDLMLKEKTPENFVVLREIRGISKEELSFVKERVNGLVDRLNKGDECPRSIITSFVRLGLTIPCMN